MNGTPAPDLPNLGMLIKLMKLTASSNDAEALLAVRKANEQLIKFGGDWEALLSGKVTVIGDPFVSLRDPPPEEVSRGRGAPSAPTPPRPQPTPQPPLWRSSPKPRPQAQARPQPKPQPKPQPTPTPAAAAPKPKWSNVDRVQLDDIV